MKKRKNVYFSTFKSKESVLQNFLEMIFKIEMKLELNIEPKSISYFLKDLFFTRSDYFYVVLFKFFVEKLKKKLIFQKKK